jgi:hypothetical protein
VLASIATVDVAFGVVGSRWAWVFVQRRQIFSEMYDGPIALVGTALGALYSRLTLSQAVIQAVFPLRTIGM